MKLQKSSKKFFDPTRKGTLTVPFHTIPPSESFGWWVYRQPQTRRPISGGGSCLSGYINKLGHAVEGVGAEQAELLLLFQRAEQRDAAPQQGGYDGDLVAVNEAGRRQGLGQGGPAAQPDVPARPGLQLPHQGAGVGIGKGDPLL